MDNEFKTTIERLSRFGQEHVTRFIDRLDAAARQQLLAEIGNLDLEMINELVGRYVCSETQFVLPDEILPAPVYPAEPDEGLQRKYHEAFELGEQLIRAGKVAAFTVAGGQGTRLNIDGPKGNVPATPVRNKTLFRVFAEGIAAVRERYGAAIPWYVMTSPANHADTVASFEQNDYFGLAPDDVIHFPQGMMPAFDADGHMLLAEPGRLALSPDGHGGSLRALHTSGAIADMEKRGVEYISYFQIDNPLVYVIDPLFIGLHALEQAEMSSKAVTKSGPLEKVGNFALVDGRVTVIEYSDLPENLALQTRDDGRLVFESGSIAIHIINRSFVARLNERGFSLPWHRALKRVPHIDGDGQRVEPKEPNAVKLETFVFDALPLAKKSIILEIDRGEQFAPIKNTTGADSLETSKELQNERAARWLEEAGVSIPRKPDGTVDATLEISPLFAWAPSALAEKRSELPTIDPGGTLYLG